MHAGCIVLQILLLDAVPTIGIRSLLNFLTYYTPKMLRAVDAVLQQARKRVAAQQLTCGPGNTNSLQQQYSSVPIMAAQHHPMSVLQQPGMSTRGSSYMGRLQSLLAHYRVQVYVSGHLHDVFGNRQHVCHKLSEQEWSDSAAESAAAAQCPSASDDGTCTNKNENNAPVATAKIAVDTKRRCVLEMEAPGWRSSRHFRLMTFGGGVFSATDARVITTRHSGPASSETPSSAESIDLVPTGVNFTVCFRVPLIPNKVSLVSGANWRK